MPFNTRRGSLCHWPFGSVRPSHQFDTSSSCNRNTQLMCYRWLSFCTATNTKFFKKCSSFDLVFVIESVNAGRERVVGGWWSGKGRGNESDWCGDLFHSGDRAPRISVNCHRPSPSYISTFVGRVTLFPEGHLLLPLIWHASIYHKWLIYRPTLSRAAAYRAKATEMFVVKHQHTQKRVQK